MDTRQEIYQKLNKITADLKTTTDRMSEAKAQIADVEEWSVDFREALSQSLQAQESLQMKLTDLEALLKAQQCPYLLHSGGC